MGDWPCLAVMMIVVDPSTPCARNSETIEPMAASTDSMPPIICGVKSSVPGSYPPGT